MPSRRQMRTRSSVDSTPGSSASAAPIRSVSPDRDDHHRDVAVVADEACAAADAADRAVDAQQGRRARDAVPVQRGHDAAVLAAPRVHGELGVAAHAGERECRAHAPW